MFANILLQPVRPLAVDVLSISGFEFYLTDERFFTANNHGYTRWVFFVDACPEVSDFLEAAGFVIDNRISLHAQEIGCLTAYLKRIKGGEITELEPYEADVVVRLVKDAKLYNAIQESIKSTYGPSGLQDPVGLYEAWRVGITVFNSGIKYAEENTKGT